ncbi:hypothetical protein B0H14DRAFT_981692 [Mycena olivaceomarginata]|nr:hypothetical protein B0H14DRAFT_981692 [Mycena olivaceomarginata]
MRREHYSSLPCALLCWLRSAILVVAPLHFASPPAPRHSPSDLRGPPPRHPRSPAAPGSSPALAPSSILPTIYPMLHRSLPLHHPHLHRVAGETSSAVHNVHTTFKAFCRESANSSGASRASTPLLRLVWELPQRCVCMRRASGGRWGLKMHRLGEPRDVWMGSTRVGNGCARASYCGIEARARIDPDRGLSPSASDSRPSLRSSARRSLSASLQEESVVYARARSGRRSRTPRLPSLGCSDSAPTSLLQ